MDLFDLAVQRAINGGGGGGSEPNVLVVTITYSNDNFTSDVTGNEVKAALQAGKTVSGIVKVSNSDFTVLSSMTNNWGPVTFNYFRLGTDQSGDHTTLHAETFQLTATSNVVTFSQKDYLLTEAT